MVENVNRQAASNRVLAVTNDNGLHGLTIVVAGVQQQPIEVLGRPAINWNGDDLWNVVGMPGPELCFDAVVLRPSCFDHAPPFFRRLEIAVPSIHARDRTFNLHTGGDLFVDEFVGE